MRINQLAYLSIFIFFFLSCRKTSGESQEVQLKNSFSITEINIEGKPYDLKANGYNPLGRYGSTPQIITIGNTDNTFDVAWLDMDSKQIKISSFANTDTACTLMGTIQAPVGTTNKLLGFTKLPSDGSFVIAYSKDNASGDKDFEYWISRFRSTGKQVFDTRVFGSTASTEYWSKGAPASSSSACLAFNPVTEKIGFYLGHTMKWSDGVRHQGGYIGFLDLAGVQVMKNATTPVGNTWYYSHNFNEQMTVVDGKYYALAHGDSYPRALGFSVWSDAVTGTNPSVDAQYFKISGTVGDNTTNTQTGGMVSLPDGNFGIVFSSSVERAKRDVCFMKLDRKGAVLSTQWLTTNTTSDAVNPRIALKGGSKILIAWEDYVSPNSKAYFMEFDIAGTVVTDKTAIENAILQPLHTMVSLPDGSLIWAVGSASKKINIMKLK